MEKKKTRQLYKKLFLTYTAIVLLIVTALTAYFISVSRQRIHGETRDKMERMSREGEAYLKETSDIAGYLHSNLYRSDSELDDLLAYLSMEPQDYQNYALRRYAASDALDYKGIRSFLEAGFEAYDNLEKIELISYRDSGMTEFYPQGIIYPGKDGKERLLELQDKNEAEEGTLVYIKEIREPNTLEPVGAMVFSFEGDRAFQNIVDEEEKIHLVVATQEKQAVFARPEKEDWMEAVASEQYETASETVGQYQIYVFVSRSAAAHLPLGTFLAILGSGVLAAGVGIFCINYYLNHLTDRVDAILQAMNQVTTGNLQVRLEADKSRDELDMVANHFNSMCENLELYINKSYLAEIEKKNAEMQALVSQINPHFLYNTLEAIRMKAICNGDREVGRMLYSMVSLFRSQLKEADIITLGQELDYCKQYLELFEYRYQGSFRSTVECPAEYLALPVMKFILQPLIENYFVHGIQRDRDDNEVSICVEKQDDTLYLYVKDNGRGMAPEKLKEKNRELADNLADERGEKSIGITNVNRRIKAVYGESYGISLAAVETGGLLVTLKIRVEEGKTDEESYACGG